MWYMMKPVILRVCKCGNDTFREYEIHHRWSPEKQCWRGTDNIHRCTKCGKVYYDDMDLREHPDIDYFNRPCTEEVYMGREEFEDYLLQNDDHPLTEKI